MIPVPFNTNIYLFKGCPNDQKYENTLYFDSLEKQKAFYLGKFDKVLKEYSFLRIEDNYMLNVEIPFEEANTYNYMMFTNNNNKTWFCFISRVEYISDNVTRLYYTLDYIQSYLFDFYLTNSMVDRCHDNYDIIGGNIVDEGFTLSNYIQNEYYEGTWSGKNIKDLFSSYSLVLVADFYYDSVENDIIRSLGSYSRNEQEFSGLVYSAYRFSDLGTGNYLDLNYVLEQAVKKETSAGIQAILVVPSFIVPTVESFSSKRVYPASRKFNLNYDKLNGTEYLDKYQPINKKMYQYPYNFLRVENTATGENLDLAYEFFNNAPSLSLDCVLNINSEILLTPRNYDGEDGKDYKNCISFTFYVADWSSDFANALKASQGGGVATFSNVFKSLFDSALKINLQAGGGYGQAISNVAGIVGNFGALNFQYKNHPTDYHSGNVASRAFMREVYPRIERMSVRSEDAKRIDNYFSRYGYKQSKMMLPDRNARKYYTYIKTIECQGHGNVSNGVEEKLKSIYNNGLTFWNTEAYSFVGDYNDSIMRGNTPKYSSKPIG